MKSTILKLTLFFLFFLFFFTSSYARHIFGGYIGMTQLDRATGRFRITLVMYIDMDEIDQDAENGLYYQKEDCNIFRKSDGKEMLEIELGKATIVDSLIYDNPSCAKLRNLRTRQYTFQLDVTLPPNQYADPGGYYLAKERCCRNGALTNIVDARSGGMVFYSEFPALLQNGQPIRYSSPRFGSLNGDYICVNKLFQYDFSATDPDGDELRYTLADPIAGNTNLINNATYTKKGPYPAVKWVAGFSASNAIKGPLPLRIDPKKGILSVRASQIGLFLFSVKVEKIRNGQVIGAMQHDFQLPVVDCSGQTPPVPVITYNGKAVTQVELCEGEKLTLQTTASAEWAFQWVKNGDNLDEARNNQFVVSEVGEYAVVKSWLKTCANDTISATVKVVRDNKLAPVQISAKSRYFCPGDSTQLKATSADSVSFEWSKNNVILRTGSLLQAKQSGLYVVKTRKTGTTCVGDSDSLRLEEWPLPSLSLPQDSSLCRGDTLFLQTTSNGSWQYEWYAGTTRLAVRSAALLVSEAGVYRVKATDGNGCSATSGVYKVGMKANCGVGSSAAAFYIPDAFTPNADGLNETWELKSPDKALDLEVAIYNRWGLCVFWSRGYAQPWDATQDGQPVAAGVYGYVIVTPQHTYRGAVWVLR